MAVDLRGDMSDEQQSSTPFSDTAKKNAKALKKLAEDEFEGMRPSHMACLRIAAANPRENGEPREVWAARMFEAHKATLLAAAQRKGNTR